ncbi:hypothetical protein J2Y66_000852 [Paenarthrobacter nitroguajacolicus]|nr:hypothetical protein [Paenarthrobacter nitroguajacolicus]
MYIEGNIYLRLVAVPVRKGLLLRGDHMYEVLTYPGHPRVVSAKELAGAVGVDPRGPWNDLQECQRVADRLYREGRKGEWVEYHTAIIVPDSPAEGDAGI